MTKSDGMGSGRKGARSVSHQSPASKDFPASRDRRALGTSIAFVATLLVLASTGDGTIEPAGIITAICFASAMGVLAYVAIRSELLIVATLVITVGLAVANSLAPAASSGIILAKASALASAESVQFGAFLVVLFQGTIVLVTASVLGRSDVVTKASQSNGSRTVWLFGAAILSVTFVTGNWTYYGGERAEVELGALQFHYLYLPTLLGLFALSLRRLGRTSVSLTAVLFFLVFATQMRRLMVTVTVLAMVTLMLRRRDVPWLKLTAGAAVAALLISAGSAAWRRSSEELVTPRLSERLVDTVRRLGEIEGVADQFRERASVFVWLNGLAVEHQPKLAGTITMTELLTSTLWTAAPGAIAASKYDVVQVSCETSLAHIGLGDLDLPCTPESEAYLAAGLPGVLSLAVFWGLFLVLVERLWERSAFGTLLAAHLFFFMSIVESSAFPQVHGIRSALLVLGLTAPIFGFAMVRQRMARALGHGPRPRVRRHLGDASLVSRRPDDEFAPDRPARSGPWLGLSGWRIPRG